MKKYYIISLIYLMSVIDLFIEKNLDFQLAVDGFGWLILKIVFLLVIVISRERLKVSIIWILPFGILLFFKDMRLMVLLFWMSFGLSSYPHP